MNKLETEATAWAVTVDNLHAELAQCKELLDTALEQNQIIGELHQHAVMELARCKDEFDFFERAAYWETADESVITEAAIDDAFDEAMKGTT